MADGNQTYSRAELARRLAVSARTLRRWEHARLLVAQRWPSGRPFYTQAQVDELIKVPTPGPGESTPPPSDPE